MKFEVNSVFGGDSQGSPPVLKNIDYSEMNKVNEQIDNEKTHDWSFLK